MPLYRRPKKTVQKGTPNKNNKSFGFSNLIRLKNQVDLPYPMNSGEISWQYTFEDFPSGSLSYTGVLAEDLEAFEEAFDYLGDQEAIAKIEGIEFYCQRPFSYELNSYYLESAKQEILAYTINVSLVSVYGVKAKKEVLLNAATPLAEGVVNIAVLADYVGVPYVGDNFVVDLPDQVSPDTTISLFSAISDEARVLGSYFRCENGIELVEVDNGKRYTFQVGEILNADGENSISPPPFYNRTELTWNKDPLAQDLELKEPKVEKIVKEDANPEEPPAVDFGVGDDVFCDAPWPNMFVNGGPTKTRVTTTLIEGSPSVVDTEIYGYKFDSRDIDELTEVLDTAQAYWQLCETTKTEYIYDSFKSPRYSVKVKDISNPEQPSDATVAEVGDGGVTYLAPIIHPDYTQYAKLQVDDGLRSIVIDLGTQYMVQEKTTGRKLMVLRREEGFELVTALEDLAAATDEESLTDAERLIEAYTQRFVTVEGVKSYKLRNKRQLYKPFQKDLNDYEENFVGNPFSLQVVNYNSLSEKLKAAVPLSPEYIGYDGRVAILTPDPNFIEPFVIEEEAYLKGGLFFADTAESLKDDPDRINQKDTTGEETYTRISRKVTAKNRHSQLSSEYSSNESGFERVFNKVTEEDVLGQLPDAQTRKADWQDKQQKVRRRDPSKLTRVFATSDRVTDESTIGGSANFQNASSKEQAILAAETDLRIKGWQESNQSKNCAWYYPGLRPGDFINTPHDLFGDAGNWRLLSASFSLSIKGDNESETIEAFPLAFTSGTSITTGLDLLREVEYEEEPDIRDRQLEADDTVVELDGQNSLGEIILSIPTRRKL